MEHKGVEFSLVQAEPGTWKWCFQIGEIVTTGKTEARLMGLAIRKVQLRINSELRKRRDVIPGQSDRANQPP
jgi:hypothetical protein